MPGTSAYREPASTASYEEKIKRSVFIADVSPCHDEGEARDFLSLITTRHRDATHNCRAYLLKDGREYSSDDGEPSGTAGRPILGAIKHSGLVNVMVIVTRYYGGVHLGVRGLIEAYGGIAAKALDMAGSVERVITSAFRIELGYNAVGSVTRLLEACGAVNAAWDYSENVRVSCDVPVAACEGLSRELGEMTARGMISGWEKLSP
ncbi:MAG: YigZ family protein [Synergistaceae bacterium]|nr:YigZ family protein [Synergistaceae bacterium]